MSMGFNWRSVSHHCPSSWPNGIPPNTPRTHQEALDRIDHLYDSGVPFFTKDNIRSIYDQIQAPHIDGDQVTTKDITGSEMTFTLQTGKIRNFGGWHDSDVPPEKRVINHQPHIIYNCRSHLKHNIWSSEETGNEYSPETMPHLVSLQIFQRSTGISQDGTEELPSKEYLAECFQENIQAWQRSHMCKEVLHILNQSASKHQITKVIGVALGALSFNRDNSSAFQHALILTIQEWLQTRNQEISCYVQDPINSDVDAIVLNSHGVEVIDDPRAWLELDEKSILFSCAPNIPVKEIVADIARPAVVIWEEVDFDDCNVKGGQARTDPCSPRVRAMLEGYEMFDFGADDHFCRTVIYIRRCLD